MKKVLLAVAVLTMVCGDRAAFAVDKWWDVNNTAADSGQAGGTGTWSTAVSNWNTDPTGGAGGALSAWTSGTADRAFFSAGGDATGAFTINVPTALTTGALTIEEGTVTKTGAALSVQNITVNDGAKFFINAANALTVAAGGSLTLNGPNATIGNANTGSGGSFLGNSSANTNMPITLNGGGHISANGGAGIVTIYTGLIKGTGPLVIDGNGVFRLTTTTATYSGATIINGTLQMSTTANVLPSGTALTINSGGKYDLQTSQTVASLDGAGNLAATSSNQLTIAGTASTTYSGVWSGGRINVDKSGGTGTLTLTGVNTSSGRFTLTKGNVIVDAAASLCGDIADVDVNGGVLTLNQAAEKIENLSGTGGSIVLNNAALSLISDPVASTSYAGIISGSGGLTRQNANATTRTLTLTGENTYDGNTIIDKGIIAVGNASALGSTTGYTQVTATGAEVLFTGAATNFTVSEPLRIAGTGATNGGAISVIASATPTLSGPVTLIGDATIAVSSTAGLTLNNANAITSTANENLTLQGGSGAGAGGTISGEISLGAGSLTKLQGGTWTLSGSNSYSGGTTISGGTLKANNSTGSATGSGAVTINSGGTLAGSGAVAGNVSANGGGNVSPGNSIESLAVGGDLSLAAASTFVVEIDTTAPLTPNSDLLTVGGALNIAPGALIDFADIAATSQLLADTTKLTLMAYNTGAWNLGLFTSALDSSLIGDDSLVTIGANTYIFDYNDTIAGGNFASDSSMFDTFVTLTAVPEPTAFLFGSLGCGLLGLGYLRRKYVARRAAIAA
jgi:autotransporter-associated beta strand protein